MATPTIRPAERITTQSGCGARVATCFCIAESLSCWGEGAGVGSHCRQSFNRLAHAFPVLIGAVGARFFQTVHETTSWVVGGRQSRIWTARVPLPHPALGHDATNGGRA